MNPAHAAALETTLLVHGVPTHAALDIYDELCDVVRAAGAQPALVGVLEGVPTAGLTRDELARMLDQAETTEGVQKANTANIGVLLQQKKSAATTVSTTMEIAAAAGVRVFATGGIGGVHREYSTHLDISADLAAFTRFPVAVVTSGVKSILDVVATREVLETLGVPVIGYQTDVFPAFYVRTSEATIDARMDDSTALSSYIEAELERTARGVVVANAIPKADEIPQHALAQWTEAALAQALANGATGRGVTPAVLGALHEISEGQTLRANISLALSNAKLAGELAAQMTDKTAT